jgi:hypothetical protein
VLGSRYSLNPQVLEIHDVLVGDYTINGYPWHGWQFPKVSMYLSSVHVTGKHASLVTVGT